MVYRIRCSGYLEKTWMDSTLREDVAATTREVSRAFAEGKVTKDEALKLALDALSPDPYRSEWIVALDMDKAITAIKEALAQQEQEPVAMRMPKVGDEVICIEDDSLGTVAYLTAGGSPEIRFDDGSHGTYMLREFAELFRYTSPPAQRTWVGLTDEDDIDWEDGGNLKDLVKAIEAKLKEKNT